MAGDGDNVVVPFDADVLAGEYIGHVKAVAGSVGKTHVCKDAVHFLFLFK